MNFHALRQHFIQGRVLWLGLGVLSVALGAIGIVLPLLPTTPFLLVAAFAFSRSSQRLHDWLHRHRIFGPIIEQWNRHGAISRRTKIIGVGSMIAAIALSLALGLNPVVLSAQAFALLCSALFVLTRPLPPDE